MVKPIIQYWDEIQQKTLLREATDSDLIGMQRASETKAPASVTAAQARLALLAAGLLDLVQPAIDALPEPGRSAAQIQWEFGATVDRSNQFTIALATALQLSETQMDDLFIAASGM